MSKHEITIRILDTSADAAAVRRLAQLDSAGAPAHPLLGAEQNGRLVAAVSLAGDGAIADPFLPTATATELLRLRAAQLRGGVSDETRPGRGRLTRHGRRRARGAALAPPGSSGALLQLGA